MVPLKVASVAEHLQPPFWTRVGSTMHDVVAQEEQSQVGATALPVLPIHTVCPELLVTLSDRSVVGQVAAGLPVGVGVPVGPSGAVAVFVAVAVAVDPAAVAVAVPLPVGMAVGVAVVPGVPAIWQASV
jgi:hypothetical protein